MFKMNYAIFLFVIFCFSTLLFAKDITSSDIKTDKLLVELFFRQNCQECYKVKNDILPQIEYEFNDQCVFHKLDIADAKNYLRLSAYLEFFKCTQNAPVYIVVGKTIILSGTDNIHRNLKNSIISSLAYPCQSTFDDQKLQTSLLEKRAAKFSVMVIFIAGLIDGINPCVFATLVFFISILFSAKVSGRKILVVGGVYCLACFLTYFLLGFGIFKFLSFLSSHSLAREILEWTTIIVLFVFSIVSFIDAYRFCFKPKTDNILLQLPDTLKTRIHAIMRKRLFSRFMLGGVFIIGILVTIIESVCTGQVYVPTLVLLTQEKGINIWLFYLFLYNLAFIIPLLIIYALAWRGASTMNFITWSKRHVVYSKIILGLFFIIMALLLFLIRLQNH